MVGQARQAGKLEALLEAAVDAIITIDRDGIIDTVNASAEAMFQYQRSEMLGRNVSFLMPAPMACEHDGYIRAYQNTGKKKIIGIGREVEGQRKDGTVFPMHLSVSEYRVNGQVHYAGIIHDLTVRKQTEAAVQQAQKMEAIGQLSGGIAHDFNNLLTIITGNLELLEMQIDEPGLRALIKDAVEAAELGAELTDQLLTFARRRTLEASTTNINDVVEGLRSMLERTLGSHIELRTSLARDLWLARVDEGQLQNALINLCVNARDAMPTGGRLMIETRAVNIDSTYAEYEVGLETGDYVRLSVSDTGHGMAAALVKKAFEPFFTTKETGRGTGLGLSMVYGFAKQSGGHATIYSEVGFGTTVNIYLPRHRAQGEDVRISARSAGSDLPLGRGQLILVVEDNDRVRRTTRERLRSLNYETLEAGAGEAALELLSAHDTIALVFTDLVMPGGMSGYELIEKVHRLYPHVKTLLTSGYAEDLVHAEDLSAHKVHLLRKPYKKSDLATAIAQELAGP